MIIHTQCRIGSSAMVSRTKAVSGNPARTDAVHTRFVSTHTHEQATGLAEAPGAAARARSLAQPPLFRCQNLLLPPVARGRGFLPAPRTVRCLFAMKSP